MRFIHIGVGGFGGGWVHILKSEKSAKVVGMVDVSKRALGAACEAGGYSDDICFQDLGACLKQVDADALLCVTPPEHHCRPVVTAMKAGLDVISEKPMADSMANCRKMLKTARETGRTYVVSQNYRYAGPMWTIAHLVRQGKIGQIGQVKVDFYMGFDFGGGFRHSMDYPLVIDMSIHHFDLMRFITGLNPVNVAGTAWNPAWSNYKGDSSNALVFEMDNGARITYNGSWSAKGTYSDWNGNWLIEGDKGAITYDNGVITLHAAPQGYAVKESTEIKQRKVPYGGGQSHVLNRFIHCLRNGETPETVATDNIYSVAMVYASVRAIKTGRKTAVIDHATRKMLS